MNQSHLKRIDVLRAVAILLVFFHHYWVGVWQLSHPSLQPPVNTAQESWINILLFPAAIGFLGVKLFFVISGFCIHYSYLNWRNKAGSQSVLATGFLPTFFWRRFWRIYPPYFLTLIFFYYFAYSHPFSLHSIKQLSVHAFLMNSLFPAFFYNINYSFWSIAVEWQLYLIYPLFLWIALAKRIEVAFGLACIIAFSINYAGPHLTSSFLILKSPFAYWFEWTIGALLADYFVQGRKVFRWHPIQLGCLLVWMCLAYSLPGWGKSGYFVSTLFFAVLVEWMIHFKRPVGRAEKILIPIGLCSYSLYLVHQPYLIWLFKLAPSLWTNPFFLWTWVVLPLLLLAPILGFSWLYYRWVETGSISMGKHLWKRFAAKTTSTISL